MLGTLIALLGIGLWAGDGSSGYRDKVDTLTEILDGGVGGVTTDRLGFIYVADFGEKVWKVTPQGEVTVFVDTMYGASGNGIDSRGNLLQNSFNGNFLARISRGGEVEILVDQGLSGPVGVAVAPDDTMYVCNCRNNTISKVMPDGTLTEFAKSDLLNCPNGITLVRSDLYVVNFSDGAMVKIDSEGKVTPFATIPGGGNGHVTFARGFLYATSFRGNKVYRVGLDGKVRLFAGTGAKGTVDGEGSQAQFSHPNGIAASPTGNRLYINDFLGNAGVISDDPRRSVLRRIKLASLTDIFTNTLTLEGLPAAVNAFREFKNNSSSYTEIETNALGYRLMNTNRLDAAIEVFKLNVEYYPKSFNTYDSLGEAYKKKGEKTLAIKNYKKSLELNPQNTNATKMLAELGE